MELKSSLITHREYIEKNNGSPESHPNNRTESQKINIHTELSTIFNDQNNLEILFSPDYISKKMRSTPSQAYNKILWT